MIDYKFNPYSVLVDATIVTELASRFENIRTPEENADDVFGIYIHAKNIVDEMEDAKKHFGNEVTSNAKLGEYVDLTNTMVKRYERASSYKLDVMESEYPEIFKECVTMVPKLDTTKLKKKLATLSEGERDDFNNEVVNFSHVIDVRLTGTTNERDNPLRVAFAKYLDDKVPAFECTTELKEFIKVYDNYLRYIWGSNAPRFADYLDNDFFNIECLVKEMVYGEGDSIFIRLMEDLDESHRDGMGFVLNVMNAYHRCRSVYPVE